MNSARRRELAEKWASKVIDPLAFPQFLESAFLELEREVREETWEEAFRAWNAEGYGRDFKCAKREWHLKRPT